MADNNGNDDRVTIVETDGGGGSGGVLAVVLLVIVVLVLLFLFRDQLGFGGDDTDITIPTPLSSPAPAARRYLRPRASHRFTIHVLPGHRPPQEIDTGPDVRIGDTFASTQEIALR